MNAAGVFRAGGRAVRGIGVVPLAFLGLAAASVFSAGLDPLFVFAQVIVRFDRYAFLALALILPAAAGLGLNFGIVIGAMAGQAALILVSAWGLGGLPGFLLAAVIAVPFGVGSGWLVGLLYNRAKGREMITGLIAGFFANGLWQILFLFLVGSLIPFANESLLVPRGGDLRYGLQNTFPLTGMADALDAWPAALGIPPAVQFGFARIPLSLGTWAAVLLAALLIRRLFRSKLGQEFLAMGQDARVAETYGIPVNRNRILAVVLSTVLAAWGQMIYLQNLGKIDVYSSHQLVGMFSIAAILVAGASAERATIRHAIFGVLLFHSLDVALPQAAGRLFAMSELGEYLRKSLMYGIIAAALAVHAWRRVRALRAAGARAEGAAA